MKPWIAPFAIALACAGCAGGIAGGGAPASGPRPASLAPSDDELERSYEDFLERALCGGVARCDRARVDQVSQAECAPTGRRGRIRCGFAVHVETRIPGSSHTSLSMSVDLHLCAGLFQKRRNHWLMLSVIGQCPPHLAEAPSQ